MAESGCLPCELGFSLDSLFTANYKNRTIFTIPTILYFSHDSCSAGLSLKSIAGATCRDLSVGVMLCRGAGVPSPPAPALQESGGRLRDRETAGAE